MIIREAENEDIDNGLLNVFIEGYRYHQKGRPDVFPDISNEQLEIDLKNGMETLKHIVAIDNNVIVGYLAYKIKEKHTKKLDVDQLIVSEKYRGKKIGGSLMKYVEEIANKEKCDRIELNCWMFNTNALNMYEHIGYTRQRIIYEKSLR